MESNSIFITQDEINNKSLSNISFTDIIETIPKNSLKVPLPDWENKYKVEWRWRFFQFDQDSKAEISYIKKNSKQRVYFNKKGEWVIRIVPEIYDEYVTNHYFYYTL